MICSVCAESGLRSIVHVTGTKATQIPKEHFWDEHGEEHWHDPNTHRTRYRCSNGHQFEEVSSWQCGACGYMACAAKVTSLGQQQPHSGEEPEKGFER